jgi:hypothetical protein
MESPVIFHVKYPEKLSQGMLLVRLFFASIYVGIPHMICLAIFEIGACFVMFIAWWCILFTGKYPEKMFHFVLRFYRWYLRVMVYCGFLTDQYPPFSGVKDVPGYDSMEFDIAYPEKLSQGMLIVKTLFGQLFVLIPHMFCLMFYAIWVCILYFLSWWVVLFTGKFPRGWFDTIVNFYRWYLRVLAYFPLMMTDVYPPFSGKE